MNGPEAVRGARDAHELLVRSLEDNGFSDVMARRASLLPEWTVGHLLTHLARNADSYCRMIDAATAGEIVVQYPGGAAQRDSDIARGADRTADQLMGDLTASDDALAAAFGRVDPGRWLQAACRFRDQPWPLFDLPFLRWREVAIHMIDVGIGSLTSEVWPSAYVEHELRRQMVGLTQRLPERQAVVIAPRDAHWSTIALSTGEADAAALAVVDAPSRDILAWMVGRRRGERGWPPLAEWRGIP